MNLEKIRLYAISYILSEATHKRRYLEIKGDDSLCGASEQYTRSPAKQETSGQACLSSGSTNIDRPELAYIFCSLSPI